MFHDPEGPGSRSSENWHLYVSTDMAAQPFTGVSDAFAAAQKLSSGSHASGYAVLKQGDGYVVAKAVTQLVSKFVDGDNVLTKPVTYDLHAGLGLLGSFYPAPSIDTASPGLDSLLGIAADGKAWRVQRESFRGRPRDPIISSSLEEGQPKPEQPLLER